MYLEPLTWPGCEVEVCHDWLKWPRGVLLNIMYWHIQITGYVSLTALMIWKCAAIHPSDFKIFRGLFVWFGYLSRTISDDSEGRIYPAGPGLSMYALFYISTRYPKDSICLYLIISWEKHEPFPPYSIKQLECHTHTAREWRINTWLIGANDTARGLKFRGGPKMRSGWNIGRDMGGAPLQRQWRSWLI